MRETDTPEGPLSPLAKLALAAEILAGYARARRLLRRDGLRAALEALRAVDQGAPGGPSGPAAQRTGVRLGRAVARTLAPLPADSRCLMRSLVLTSLLARRGISSSLVIGVRSAGKFGAHAWVEHDGQPLLPTGRTAAGDAAFERLVEV